MDDFEKPQAQKSSAADILRPPQAANYLGISQSKLAKLRMKTNRSEGPRFSKISGCVVYRRVDLDAWIESNVVAAE